MGQDVITFRPKVMDQKSRTARLITPNSNLTGLFGTLPDIPDVTSDISGRILHRIEIEGTTVFIFEEKNGYKALTTMNDLYQSGAQKFATKEDCIAYMRAEIHAHRAESVKGQFRMWQNRADGWESRAHMYLSQLMNWRWRAASLKGIAPTDAAVYEIWNEYLKDPDHASTVDLANRIRYRPSESEIRQGVRGRVPANSPRSGKMEIQLLKERNLIEQRLSALRRQLNEMSSNR